VRIARLAGDETGLDPVITTVRRRR